jgi:hypothetical protein
VSHGPVLAVALAFCRMISAWEAILLQTPYTFIDGQEDVAHLSYKTVSYMSLWILNCGWSPTTVLMTMFAFDEHMHTIVCCST